MFPFLEEARCEQTQYFGARPALFVTSPGQSRWNIIIKVSEVDDVLEDLGFRAVDAFAELYFIIYQADANDAQSKLAVAYLTKQGVSIGSIDGASAIDRSLAASLVDSINKLTAEILEDVPAFLTRQGPWNEVQLEELTQSRLVRN